MQNVRMHTASYESAEVVIRLTPILPIVAINEKLKCSEDILVRALAMSHLITYYIKSHLGRLSALCRYRCWRRL